MPLKTLQKEAKMSSPNSMPTLLIDGYGFVFRAYHVQPPLTSPQGEPVGALYGFTSMLMKLLNDFRPAKCAVVFDGHGKNFRHEIYPDYKAHRPPVPEDLIAQLPLVRVAASALNFPILEKEGTEADDVIATIAKKLSDKGEKVVVVSSDKDLMQLISDNVIMYDPMKSKYLDAASVYEKFGVGPDKVRDALTLMGDASDNIPGAPGIGPKSAAELINNLGHIEQILNNTDQIKQDRRRKIIEEHKKQIELSWELVALKYDIDIKLNHNLNWNSPCRNTLSEFIAKYGFKSLMGRAEKLFGMDLEGTTTTQESNIITKEIDSDKILDELFKNSRNNGYMSVFLDEHKRLNLAIDNKYHYTISEGLDKIPDQADLFTLKSSTLSLDKLYSAFTDSTIKKLTFDLKKHIHFFKELKPDIKFEAFDDLALMHYTTSAGLTQASAKEFIELNPITSFISTYKEYIQTLKSNSNLSLYHDIDLPICHILYDMEAEGVKIDQTMLAKMSKDFEGEIKSLEKNIYDIAGTEFNVGSPKQLGKILFEKMGLPAGKISKKTKTYSTSAEVIENLSLAGFEIADLILRYRAITKLKSTYTDALPKQINPKTGRVHTNFIQNLTSTGRLSSQDPNLQNIPIRTPEGALIRNAFIAEKDNILISADYSQIELRLLCHFADTPNLTKAFTDGIDIHTSTAAEIFHKKMEEITPDVRREAKAINFGIIYGISAFGLAKQLGIDAKKAGEYIELYFQKYPGIKKYIEDTKEFAHRHEYVKNIFGRKCLLPLISNKNYAMRSFAERAAINAPLQGSNADIIKLAMINLAKIFKEQNLKTKMILQVHDELIFESPKDEVEKVVPIIRREMQNVATLKVPMLVDVKIGRSWGEMENFSTSSSGKWS